MCPLSPIVAGGRASAEETAPLSTASGLLVGTVEYMSPEQLQGGNVDRRTDIFALGLVLYEMASGTNPFIGHTPTSTMANILKDEPGPILRRNFTVPVELERIVQKCLRKSPADRYPAANALLRDLASLRRSLDQGPTLDTNRNLVAGAAPLLISRRLARVLFMAIQLGYLGMYGAALYKFHDVLRVSHKLYGSMIIGAALLVDAVIGIPLRIYFFTALGLDFADIGRQFRLIFPAVLVIDLLWSATPLLFLGQLQGAVLLCSAALAFLPLSQRTLLYEAYASRGGRSSSILVRRD